MPEKLVIKQNEQGRWYFVGDISGKTYASREECELAAHSFFRSSWIDPWYVQGR